MRELLEKFPDVELLLGLEPEELGAEILFFLKGRKAEARFDPAAFFPQRLRCELIPHAQATKRYPRDRIEEVQLAVTEAFNWLAVQGLIVPRPEVDETPGGAWCLGRRARQFTEKQEFSEYRMACLLPKELLHPKLVTEVRLSFMRGVYETAVFEAMREVEIAVRTATGYKASDHGMPMMRNAFHPDNGPLTDVTVDPAERQAMRELFVGAIGLYKNPHSHRHAPIDGPRWAIEMILLASHLLYVVDARVEAIRAAA